MKFCSKCGNQLQIDDRFCNKCGSQSRDVQQASQNPQGSYPAYRSQTRTGWNRDIRSKDRFTSGDRMPGERLLLVVGILMIIVCAQAMISYMIMYATIDTWIFALGGAAARGAWQFRYAYGIFICIYGIIIGIMGIVHRKDVYRGNQLMILGIVKICVEFLGIFITAGIIGTGGLTFLGILFSLPLPVLYIVGAVKNKNEVG